MNSILNNSTTRWWTLAGVFFLVALHHPATAKVDIAGEYQFHLCDPVQDDRLLPLAVYKFDPVTITATNNALDICEGAFDMNWRIENRMHAKLCILDDTRIEPLIRVDKVLSTRIMPEDPHNIALEAGLKEAIPLVDKISFQGDLIVLENDNGRVCLALEKIKKEGDTQDNN